MRLKGKVCVVTAAGQGIGAATARAFAREGATVWATDVDAGKLSALNGVDGIRTHKLDVLDKAAIGALAKQTGAVDVLFNCAGFVHHGAVLDATDEQWAFAFDLNVRSMFWTIQAFLPGMVEKGGGSIVNMSSAASSVKGAALRCIYGTTKAAVIGLTKSVAVDYVAKGVRCNAICPGTVADALARRAHRLPGRRAGRPEVLPAAPADRPLRLGRRDRRPGGLSRQRRGVLHHRHGQRDRRRLERLTRGYFRHRGPGPGHSGADHRAAGRRRAARPGPGEGRPAGPGDHSSHRNGHGGPGGHRQGGARRRWSGPGRSWKLPRSSRFSGWEQSSPSARAARPPLSRQPGRPACRSCPVCKRYRRRWSWPSRDTGS